jgi:hypothetical protein
MAASEVLDPKRKPVAALHAACFATLNLAAGASLRDLQDAPGISTDRVIKRGLSPGKGAGISGAEDPSPGPLGSLA